MKAFVDKDTCIGCAACEGVCPEIFSIEDDGLAVAIDLAITDDLMESANEACEGCPVGAISIR